MKKLIKIMDADTNREKTLKEYFSKHLKDLREERCLSQCCVAKKLGCAVSTYANWEQGRREPSIFDIYNLLYIFEIDANELFDVEL